MTHSHKLSHTSNWLHVLASSFDWFTGLIVCFLSGQWLFSLVLVFTKCAKLLYFVHVHASECCGLILPFIPFGAFLCFIYFHYHILPYTRKKKNTKIYYNILRKTDKFKIFFGIYGWSLTGHQNRCLSVSDKDMAITFLCHKSTVL